MRRCSTPAAATRADQEQPIRIFTIGYEGATQDELVARLKEAGVRLLADVRAIPLSRRPGFSKNILASGLRAAGIDYIGLKALGTPAEGREAARRHDLARLRRVYAGQLELPEAMAQAAQLIHLAQERPTHCSASSANQAAATVRCSSRPSCRKPR